jgi:DNA-3-methyladenine glycosylase
MPRPPTTPATPLPPAFYNRPADEVARDLLGRHLALDSPPGRLVLRLVEVEAYLGRIDRASHAWGGRRTPRNESLYAAPGHAYVYLIYGLHHCLNVVTAGEAGGAVLLRAGEVVEGGDAMMTNRGRKLPLRPGDLAGGPGKLCQALGIDRTLDGLPFGTSPLHLLHGEPVDRRHLAIGPRIGIGYAEDAVDWPLRFAISGHSEMSRPRLERQTR